MANVFIVEDHNIVRDGIRSIIEREAGFKVVNEARNEDELLQKLSQDGLAEILLVGSGNNEEEDLKLLHQIKQEHRKLRVILLSSMDDEKYVGKAFKLGADGFLLKTVSQDEMLFAIRHVSAGEKYICSNLSVKLLEQLSNASELIKSTVELSKRELEVLGLIAEGFTNNEIANKLFTSRRTVEGHRQNLLDKTNTRNTAALIRFAVKNGLV